MIPKGYPTGEDIAGAVSTVLCESAIDFDLVRHPQNSPRQDLTREEIDIVAEAVVDQLVAMNMVTPADRLEDECHVCLATVGEHTVDGRHPYHLPQVGSRWGAKMVAMLTTTQWNEWEAEGRT